ncbi:hypothetical protein Daus18300_011435 [Diaporthe australafricana]|uniref:Uncharacterized protein n=1 Tax=Diaporthe australafricana TaxID=127596 RepID=A0ABR3W6J3_9PEZI
MLFIILTLIAATLLGLGQAVPSTNINLARDDKNPNLTHIICQPQMFLEARRDFTDQNIKYLHDKEKGPAYLGPNTTGKQCTRVSCQYASGIYACNDNDHAVQVPLDTLADYAQAVREDTDTRCNYLVKNYKKGKLDKWVSWGQAFDINGWNVIVGFWHSDEKC